MIVTEGVLTPFAEGVWVDSTSVRILGMPLTATMTVLRLSDGSLLVHSPVGLTPERRAAIEALGPVAHLYAPNLYHHLWLGEWAAACSAVRYPVVVKWADPIAAMARLHAHGLALQKLEFAADEAALRRIGERFAPAGIWPLIQEYCPGRGLGQFFFMHEGRAVRRFQHQRIAEWPPEGGFSSVCDAVPLSHHQELQERSIALLQAIGWEGCAIVEYRLDDATGEAALMEVNGRFWGSFPLAVQAGAGFANLAYHLQGLGQTPELPPLTEELRCRMVTTELKRLVRILHELVAAKLIEVNGREVTIIDVEGLRGHRG